MYRINPKIKALMLYGFLGLTILWLAPTGVFSPMHWLRVEASARQFHETGFWGRVVDHVGHPIAGAELTLEVVPLTFRGVWYGGTTTGMETIRMTTDADGRFSLKRRKVRYVGIRQLAKEGYVHFNRVTLKQRPTGLKLDGTSFDGFHLAQQMKPGFSFDQPAVFHMLPVRDFPNLKLDY